jgi:dipeptidase E
MKSLVASLLFLGAACTVAAASFHTSPRASVLVCGGSMMNGNHFADSTLPAMREHYAGVRSVVLVLHASHPEDRDRMEARLQQAFEHLGGIKAESLHRHDPAGQRRLLEAAESYFVGGGETFILLGEMHRQGQLEIIRRRVLAGVPYGGASAGANVAGLVIGATNDFPVAEIPTRSALGIFPAVINPHHPTPDTKADYDGRVGKIGIYLRFNPDDTVVGLANASIARLHAGRVTITAGTAWLHRRGVNKMFTVGQEIPELAVKP